MEQYYKIIKSYGIGSMNIREPQTGIGPGTWSIHIGFLYKCPFCGKEENSWQSYTWNLHGENYIPSKYPASRQCSGCKKSYKPEFLTICDFEKLKKDIKEKDEKKRQLEAPNKAPQQETQKSESSSNPEEQKPGLIKRLILLPFKMIYFMFISREGNIASVVLTIFGIFMDYFFSNKADGLIGRIFVSLGLVAIYGIRSYKIYKESELKFHQQLSKDVIEGISGLFSIVSKAFIGE